MIKLRDLYQRSLTAGSAALRSWARRLVPGRRILILDNNEDTLAVMEAALTDAHYRVRVTTSINEFGEWVKRWHPNLILLDVRLREGDGEELSRQLKADKATRAIPVVFCSAYITADTDLSALHCDGVICKPFSLEELHSAVQRFF